jgi:hypothetical protein
MSKYSPFKMKGHTLPGIKQSPAKQKNKDDKKSIGKKFKNSKLAKDLKKASAQVGGDLLKLQGYKNIDPHGTLHPQQTPGYKSHIKPHTSPEHKYLYKKKK